MRKILLLSFLTISFIGLAVADVCDDLIKELDIFIPLIEKIETDKVKIEVAKQQYEASKIAIKHLPETHKKTFCETGLNELKRGEWIGYKTNGWRKNNNPKR